MKDEQFPGTQVKCDIMQLRQEVGADFQTGRELPERSEETTTEGHCNFYAQTELDESKTYINIGDKAGSSILPKATNI